MLAHAVRVWLGQLVAQCVGSCGECLLIANMHLFIVHCDARAAWTRDSGTMSVKLGRFRLFALVVVVCAVLHQVGADEVEISPETARVSLEERCNRAAAREAAEAGDTGVRASCLHAIAPRVSLVNA